MAEMEGFAKNEPTHSSTSASSETDSSTASLVRSLLDVLRSPSPPGPSQKGNVLSNPLTGVKRCTMQVTGRNEPVPFLLLFPHLSFLK